jgi:5'-3' exonuclease
MTNVVIDMNNMLFRSLFVLGGFGAKSYTFDSEAETDELMRKLAMDMSFLIRLINPSRVIFAKDSKSWRKGINIEENEGYKGTRTKSAHLNWDNIFRILDEFLEICEDNGMITTQIESAEADDIMALWRDELLFNQQQHVVLISGDEDIRQLVAMNITDDKKKIFSTIFNPFMQGKNAARKLYVTERHFNDWMNETDVADIWNMNAAIDVDKGDFKRIRDTEKIRVEETNGNMIAIRKVFCGDDGDNIPSIYTWIAKEKNGDDKIDSRTGEPKKVRLTKAPFEKIFESLKNSPGEVIDHMDLMDKKDKIFQGIQKVAKHKPSFDITQRLRRQIELVVLDKNLFPKSIVDTFDETKEEQILKPRPEIGNMNLNTMLQGTRYVKTKHGGTGKGTEAGIFKEIDRLNNNKQLF